MRSIIFLAIALSSAGRLAQAEDCVHGSNRPAIDVMDRHVTPGTTTIACTQSTVTITAPSGAQRDVRLWSFQPTKR
jgi:hypothetical protein